MTSPNLRELRITSYFFKSHFLNFNNKTFFKIQSSVKPKPIKAKFSKNKVKINLLQVNIKMALVIRLKH